MKLLLLCIFCCCCREIMAKFEFGLIMGPAPAKSEKLDYPESWISQKLDHNASETTFWDQRYFVNDEFFKDPNAPIFLRIEGEAPAETYYMKNAMWYTWAKRYGANMIMLEHRFFGKSLPTPDSSPENLQYLRSQQAIGDIAYFIEQMSAENGWKSNKWILFGGSYPGNLVAWARLKYPQLIYASVSSSCPLLAKADFPEYYERTKKALNDHSPGCGDEVVKAGVALQQALLTEAGYKETTEKLSICDEFTPGNPNDIAQVFSIIGTFMVGSVQFNGSTEADMKMVCKYMQDQSVADPIERLGNVREKVSKRCMEGSYVKMIGALKNSSWASPYNRMGQQQWIYILCNELGFMQTSEMKTSLLSDTLSYEYRTQFCSDLFGSSYTREKIEDNVKYTNEYYGGTDIQVERVVFVQGSIDPWSGQGMIKNPTDESPLLIVEGGAHCQDMESPSEYDPAGMEEVRNTVLQYLDKWLDFKSS